MNLVIGVDQGASKTQVLAADCNGTIVGMGLAPGGYHAITGMQQAMEQVAAAAKIAMKDCPPDAKVVSVGAGMTGADFAHEYELLHGALSELFPAAQVRVVNDCIIALRAGTSAPDCIILCAGSGLNCGVHKHDGSEYVFGYYIDDNWQGGEAIGRQALITVFDAQNGLAAPTMLTERVLAHYQFKDVNSLLEAYALKRLETGSIKYLLQEVDFCACAGDKEAEALLRRFGAQWARYVVAGMKKLALHEKDAVVVLSGGVFKCRSPILCDSVAQGINAVYPGVKIVMAKYEPVVGGTIMAMELLGKELPAKNLEAAAVKWNLIR